MYDFKDKLDWKSISLHQKLSIESVYCFIDFIDWNMLAESKYVTKSLMREFCLHKNLLQKPMNFN